MVAPSAVCCLIPLLDARINKKARQPWRASWRMVLLLDSSCTEDDRESDVCFHKSSQGASLWSGLQANGLFGPPSGARASAGWPWQIALIDLVCLERVSNTSSWRRNWICSADNWRVGKVTRSRRRRRRQREAHVTRLKRVCLFSALHSPVMFSV